jgi:hypothetical protein
MLLLLALAPLAEAFSVRPTKGATQPIYKLYAAVWAR